MHKALCHDDPQTQAALRKTHAVLRKHPHFDRVSNLGELADRVIGCIYNPSDIGRTARQQRRKVIDSLHIMKDAGIIAFYHDEKRVRLTKRGKDAHLNRSRQSDGRPGRRQPRWQRHPHSSVA